MGGPSLRQLHAHHAIHQGGLSGALDKTREVEELLEAKEFQVARQAADHLIEYWETRILSHADAEEEGFYQEMVEKKPELQEAVVKLTRDHDLLRIIVKELKAGIREEGLTPEVLQQFHALLVVNAIHSREEERLLFEQPS
ncbi:hemerythrin domain-containing protein [Paenibacillus sp. SEL3]|uniref:Hemerythrin domain-containing protein n=1 Tax=Paenibacillus polymyxa TaxID=1406 RepID=A0A8I1IRN8_PAEPO|nr:MULTISPECIES: hemerythrin domain-containing protein [Paenibacillus]KAF6628722.1 hemerythrin domain-containing protein [Paenibacillus sp. EKM208P]KAF6570507.1 hemerythrin domain-containing protein [Paenibacillus sp. EKM206P]KAF6587967.1 hemerythrin domain-containing protein [Paenibacillus sp. EKM205P]MBM0634216.1 hemerythrin domain-containing protein [Paenibacillus polymyxa]MBO3286157.1 hemerythrin domain-containing protein [Paenibacillus polymyxa]